MPIPRKGRLPGTSHNTTGTSISHTGEHSPGIEMLKSWKAQRRAAREQGMPQSRKTPYGNIASVERPYGDPELMDERRNMLRRKARIDRLRARKAEKAGLSRGAN